MRYNEGKIRFNRGRVGTELSQSALGAFANPNQSNFADGKPAQFPKGVVKQMETQFPVYRYQTLVIGSGCAGFNAADWLWALGCHDVAILTEGLNMGTSRNTGSDKQTYYKLSLAGEDADSVMEMAKTYREGGMNGDLALAEAAGSTKAFYKLVNLGVPFPCNEYGEYVGYKTDHDPRQRATSAGPLTSKYMTQCLQRAVEKKEIPIFDGMQAVQLVTTGGEAPRVCGVLAVDSRRSGEDAMGLTLFLCDNVIAATGGPAGVYQNSVYPKSQTGSTGMLLEAGAWASNLQEWQYGLASTGFRWNVSGTYQQVLPRYVAVDERGNEREFLPDYFQSPRQALDCVFLKGYQWPFDVRKLDGSSAIDLIVHHEVFDLHHKVYLDFRADPIGLEDGFDALGREAREYLENSGALLKTPIARLRRMNPQAIELYRSHGIDLEREMLEISVCAQHNNGGIQVDTDWQTNVRGLYAAGEAAGTFGVYRPGGSALNSTQVGSMRAAEHIARQGYFPREPEMDDAVEAAAQSLLKTARLAHGRQGEVTHMQLRRAMQRRMSQCAAHIRSLPEIQELESETAVWLEHYAEAVPLEDPAQLGGWCRTRDILVTQRAVLSAMAQTLRQIGSRGSGLMEDPSGDCVLPGLPLRVRRPSQGALEEYSVTRLAQSGFQTQFYPIRPIPKAQSWFETVWEQYRRRTQGGGVAAGR